MTGKIITGFLIVIFSATFAVAHPGELDGCGGHKGPGEAPYHVHKMAMHCACNPKAKDCKGFDFRKGKKADGPPPELVSPHKPVKP
ncbi:MAG: hypothetical protein HY886_05395, partial [Deltaproteobacteria bacterium]|nr:hypothetical protein [Deltaproteobacteria bacterium]